MFFEENKELLESLIKPLTLAEIGATAGTSAQTVSNAFSDKGKIAVSAETKSDIVNAIIKLSDERANVLRVLKNARTREVVLS